MNLYPDEPTAVDMKLSFALQSLLDFYRNSLNRKRAIKRDTKVPRERVIPSFKWCPRCAKTKQAASFAKDKAQWNGLQSRCKACKKELRLIKLFSQPLKQAA